MMQFNQNAMQIDSNFNYGNNYVQQQNNNVQNMNYVVNSSVNSSQNINNFQMSSNNNQTYVQPQNFTVNTSPNIINYPIAPINNQTYVQPQNFTRQPLTEINTNNEMKNLTNQLANVKLKPSMQQLPSDEKRAEKDHLTSNRVVNFNVLTEEKFKGEFQRGIDFIMAITTLKPEHTPGVESTIEVQDTYTTAGLREKELKNQKIFMSAMKKGTQIMALLESMINDYTQYGKNKVVNEVYRQKLGMKQQSEENVRKIKETAKKNVREEKKRMKLAIHDDM